MGKKRLKGGDGEDEGEGEGEGKEKYDLIFPTYNFKQTHVFYSFGNGRYEKPAGQKCMTSSLHTHFMHSSNNE